MRDHPNPDSPNTLILSGGGNRGAIQAGALLALFERGYRPDRIVGVSVGALNGAFLAFDPGVDRVRRLLSLWRRLDGRTLFGGGSELLRALATVFLHRRAEYSNRGLRRLLERELPSRRFSDTAVDLVVVATHLETGRPRYLAEGNLVDAVLASAAVPLRLPPVEIAGELLVDGAIADPVPLATAIALGTRRIVVVEPGHACACPRVYDDALSIFSQSIAIMGRNHLEARMARVAPSVPVLWLGLTCAAAIPMTDLSRTEEMITSGYEEASSLLDAADPAVWGAA